MRSLARWGSLPLMAMPLGSWALGLNDIETNSYLNQPLDAEIGLSATAEELSTLSVSLAPVDEFLAQGLEYPAFLTSIQFRVGRNAAGENVIRVTSTQAIVEPFVTMLVTATHARGSLTREYSVLLDPPLFLPEQAASEPVAPPVTRAPGANVVGGRIERAPAAAAPPAPEPEVTRAAPPVVAPATGAQDYTVQAGDTLWGITSRVRPAGVSMNQAMLAIFDANPSAFENNINRLRRGAILRIPPASSLGGIGVAQANAEVQRQIDAWRNDVEASPSLVLLPAGDDVGAGSASGDSSERVAELEGRVSSLEAELAATEAERDEATRLLEVRSEELADLQTQLEAAPAGDEAEAVVEAEPEEAAEAEPLFADETEAEPDTAAAPDAAEETPVATETSAPSSAPVVFEDTSPSIVDRILGWVTTPIFAISGGVIVLLLGALAFLRRRRDADAEITGQWEALEAEIEDEDEDESDHDQTASLRAPIEEPDIVVVEGHAGDLTSEQASLSATAEIPALDEAGTDFDFGTAEADEPTDVAVEPVGEEQPFEVEDIGDQTLSSQTVINLDQADPIAEADFHMAYGLYDQAADLISGALEAAPGNRELKLKLLEVYFVWGNREQFLEQARSLRADIGDVADADWDKVVIMGKQICPDEALFLGATAAGGAVDLDLESGGTSAGLDFALEDEGDVDLDFGIVDADDMTLESSEVEPIGDAEAATQIEPIGDAYGATRAEPDDMLEIGAATQANLQAAIFEEGDEAGEASGSGTSVEEFDAAAAATLEPASVDESSAVDLETPTIESPTLETEGLDIATVETPMLDFEEDEDEEAEEVEQARSAAAGASGAGTGLTAELDVDELDLDVTDFADLPDDISDLPDSGATSATEVDEDLLTATGVTQVLDENQAAIDRPVPPAEFDTETSDPTTAVLEQPAASFNPDLPETEDDLDLNLADFSSALEGGDTVEQPQTSRFSGLDLDVGTDPRADNELTGTEEISPLDPQTMTEVGTKLDLARAYIDMGDPDGAKSILEEVLSEGDTGQRTEAQALIKALPA